MDLKDHLEAATDPMHPRYPLLARIRGHLHVCTSLAVVAAAGVLASVAFGAPPNSTNSSPGNIPPSSNSPWYPSLQAFEHYDSGRSHVFSMAKFGGSFNGKNGVDLVFSDDAAYPSGYNTAYLDHKNAFIQGGSYGDVQNSIGPFVAKFDPTTLKQAWFTQLRNTKQECGTQQVCTYEQGCGAPPVCQPQQACEWDYPGGMAIESNGKMYVVSGYRLYKVDPADGKVLDTLVLPTAVNMRCNYPSTPAVYDQSQTIDDTFNTSYNGINALSDGTIVVKSLYRVAGCTLDGASALISCQDSRNIPQSNLISIDPEKMQFIETIILPAPAPARPTITRYHGVDYVYLLENLSNAVRYSVDHGHFSLDTNWTPKAVPYDNQQTGGSLIVMNDWIVGATNSVPATGALTVFAINQNDATKQFFLQPYLNDPIPPELAKAFAPAISWAGMSLEVDPQNGLFYGVETLARKVAAFRITDSGIETVWKQTQTTTEWATLIGPQGNRTWVGTDIPVDQIPGDNQTDVVVFRDAATGRELAHSDQVPFMTMGSAVQPGYDGSVFFPGAEGTLVKVTPFPNSK